MGLSKNIDQADRREKSLLNTFPFSLGNEGEHDHHRDHHRDHHHPGHREAGSQEARDNAKTQHNALFPFKATEDSLSSEETVSIEDFIVETGDGGDGDTTETSESVMDQGGVDFNTIGSASTHDEDVALGRKCIDKVISDKLFPFDYPWLR